MGESLQRGVRRMDAIISDLLALSRATSGDAACNASEVVRAVEGELAPRVEREGATLFTDVAPARLRCSHGLLQQALVNLVDNALKYRRSDIRAVIQLAGRPEGAFYELRVSDNGVGMSPEETARLFEPFFRARRVPEATGTGLGLTIVKRVAESAGGSVTAHSSLGRGTTFVMRLPLAPPGTTSS